MIRDMVLLGLWGLVRDRSRIIEKLHDLGVLHLQEEPVEYVSTEAAADLKLLRGKALGLLESLGWNEWSSIPRKALEEKRSVLSSPDEAIIDGIRDSLDSFSTRVTERIRLREALGSRINSIKGALRTVRHFDSFISENSGKGLEITLWWAQRADVADLAARIRKMIREHDPLGSDDKTPYHLIVSPGGERILAIAYPSEFRKGVSAILSSRECLPWILPGEYETMSFQDAVPLMETALEDLPRRIGEIERNLMKTRQEWGPKIGALYVLLDEKIEEILVETGSDTRGEIFRLSGWVPSDEKDRLETELRGEFRERILLRWRDPHPGEWSEVPTSLSNPEYFRPFELFLRLMPVVSYKGLDPTILIGIFFPFFGGCMIGDMGYGLVIGALGLWFRKKVGRPMLNDVGSILLFIAAWSILWGVAYGEAFGDLGHRFLHLEPLWLERSQVVIPVMIFTISLGFAHVLLGFIMGMIQGLRTGHRHLWLERLGNILIFMAQIGRAHV